MYLAAANITLDEYDARALVDALKCAIVDHGDFAKAVVLVRPWCRLVGCDARMS